MMKKSRSFVNMDLVDNVWENDGTYDSMYYNAFSYDANGNILTQERYNEAGTHIEDLVYQYERNSSNQIIRNRLYHVNDSIGSGVTAGDIDDQGTFYETDVSHNINEDNNYQYDQEGRLAKDIQEGIDTIVWRVDGKIALIEKSDTTITFDYDAMGNRIAKHVYGTSGMLLKRSTYYLLDAQGNTMNVYNYVVDYIEESTHYELSERHIYGSSRLGMVNQTADPTASVESSWSHLSGKKAYELSNHLGNVLTTVTDKKIPLDENTDDAVDGYLAEILSATDYSPFGVELDGRSFSSSSYRYGFQRQEKDNEIKGEGNSINYKYRMHDPRLGRFFAIDPLAPEYSYNSPYAFSENRVIEGVELEGLEVFFSATGAYLGMLGDASHREIRVVNAKSVEEAKKYIDYAKDPSAHGLKYQNYNTEQVQKLSIPYDDASESSQAAVAKMIFEVWINPEIPVKSMGITNDFTRAAETRAPGEFGVNPNAAYGVGSEAEGTMDHLYNQVNTWYHENQHSEYKAAGNEHSGNGFYHFEIDKKAHEHWSFKYTTDAFKSNWEDNMYNYISDQREAIGTIKDPETKSQAIQVFNSNAEWLNKAVKGNIQSYSENKKE